MRTRNKIFIKFLVFFAPIIIFTACNVSADEPKRNQENTSQIYTNSDYNNDTQFKLIQNEISNSKPHRRKS